MCDSPDNVPGRVIPHKKSELFFSFFFAFISAGFVVSALAMTLLVAVKQISQ